MEEVEEEGEGEEEGAGEVMRVVGPDTSSVIEGVVLKDISCFIQILFLHVQYMYIK